MTVFKGYMRIMKKNTGLILLYLGIFFRSDNGTSGSGR